MAVVTMMTMRTNSSAIVPPSLSFSLVHREHTRAHSIPFSLIFRQRATIRHCPAKRAALSVLPPGAAGRRSDKSSCEPTVLSVTDTSPLIRAFFHCCCCLAALGRVALLSVPRTPSPMALSPLRSLAVCYCSLPRRPATARAKGA